MTWSYILNTDRYPYIYIYSIDLVLYPNNERPQISTVTMHIANSIFMFRYTHPFFISEILIWEVPIMGGYPNSWMVYTMENLKKNAGFGATPRLGIRNPPICSIRTPSTARSEAKAQQDLKVSIIAS